MDILAWLTSLWDTLCGWFSGGDGEEGSDVVSTLGTVDVNKELIADDAFRITDETLPENADDWVAKDAVPDRMDDTSTSTVRDLTETETKTSTTTGSVGGSTVNTSSWTDLFKGWTGKDVGTAATGIGAGVALGGAGTAAAKSGINWWIVGGVGVAAYVLLKD